MGDWSKIALGYLCLFLGIIGYIFAISFAALAVWNMVILLKAGFAVGLFLTNVFLPAFGASVVWMVALSVFFVAKGCFEN